MNLLCYPSFDIDAMLGQEQIWRETTDDNSLVEHDACTGEKSPIEFDNKLLFDIQKCVSRVVAKAPQLIGNQTTNLAETWMNIRCKYDGGKFINRSQSGSWEFRCMGAGLQQNLGHQWGPLLLNKMTGSQWRIQGWYDYILQYDIMLLFCLL